jgi:hypothetical protein
MDHHRAASRRLITVARALTYKAAVITVVITAVVPALMATACSSGTSRLQNGARSIDQLVSEYMEAVVAGDTAAMHALRLSEYEHNEILWPELPASRPEFNMPIAFAWENLNLHSRRDANRVLADFSDRHIEIERVDCRKGVTEYPTLKVHGDCWIIGRDGRTGIREEFKLFGSIVESEGRYKIIGIVSE